MLSTLTNKHVIVAMITAPILAIIAYFAVDYVVSEKPHSAIEGLAYPLIAKSNCRYQSGLCTLNNGDIRIDITPTSLNQHTLKLTLEASLPLQGVNIGFQTQNSHSQPQPMHTANANQTQWVIEVSYDEIKNKELLLALSLENSLYYGQTPTTFVDYHTGFKVPSTH